ncbi:hypothetical protein KP509_21G032400 [Ceratopteris richardii]|uniref:Protein kinase domain-containing protein n=1 Tax=Ceratopteris richardii TaxID=49495 RepID=A0A8T2SAN8_CERRI|nr:hypothetical protein KP509_21G032400 [Ceratopteris richardii]KAH7315070.1 hypothetical protein KP509_21G032400 [Ceratopteris richardii]
MILSARHPTLTGFAPCMDLACSRIALLDAAHSSTERVSHHQQLEQAVSDSGHMEYSDLHSHHHQYKHHHQHHYHHMQSHTPQHHHSHQLPVGGNYLDLGGGFIAPETNPVPLEALTHAEKEKQGMPQTQFIDQYATSAVQTPYKPCDDVHTSVKIHEDVHGPPKASEEVLILPGRHDSLHFTRERGYSQQQFHSPAAMLAMVRPRIRLICSTGGRIMGRPADGRLRYCGGDTRLISLERVFSFSELMSRMTQIYGSPLILKYQLPGEDLDALVSVSSDDDLQNMIEEYDKLIASNGTSWFRLFLFRNPSDCEILSHNYHQAHRKCQNEIMQRYISAINGASDPFIDTHTEVGANANCPPSKRALDASIITLSGQYAQARPPSRAPSAPSSLPSSPSVAARQYHHKQCGTVDVCHQFPKDQQGLVIPASNIEMSAQELGQDRHADSFKCDHHQIHVTGESPRVQLDYPLSGGGDAVWAKENGVHLNDTATHQLDRHRGPHSIMMDTRHDTLKFHGPVDAQCETCCSNHPVPQMLSSLHHAGQAEYDFGRLEQMQYCFMDGHKHVPIHQMHPSNTLVHREVLPRMQRGPAIDSASQSTEDPLHSHVQIPAAMSSAPVKQMGSAPSSPRDASHGRCCPCRQHCQVDRGISVSLGEHSHIKKPSHYVDQSIKRHGFHPLSRFCDGSNFCSDPAAWHGPVPFGRGLEFDEHESLQKFPFDRISNRAHIADCCAKETTGHCFMESVHSAHERNLQQCHYYCADNHDARGQQLEKPRITPATYDLQAYVRECDIQLGHTEDNLSILATGRLMYDPKTDVNVNRGNDNCSGLNINFGHGGVEMKISNVQDSQDVLRLGHNYASNLSSMPGHKSSVPCLRPDSFSSTDAVAGSLSRPSLESSVWNASPSVVYDDQTREVETHGLVISTDPVSSIRKSLNGIIGYEGDENRSPSFGGMDSVIKLRSINTRRDAPEFSAECLPPVSSLTHVPDDSNQVSYAHGSHCSAEPFPLRTLDSEIIKGSITLALPMYDQSPTNSVKNAAFSFAENDEVSVKHGKDATEQPVNSVAVFSAASNQTAGNQQEIEKVDGDSEVEKVLDQDCTPMLEESKTRSQPSSRPCSMESRIHDKGDTPLPMTESGIKNEPLHEVNTNGSANVCLEDEEKELPATQAEAEAIARGLQIIKNDDLEDLRELGSGTYGTVFHGKWRGSDVAIKRIKASCFTGRPSVQERLISDFWREAGTLSQLHHPNIVAFYGVVPDGPEGTLATVTEYMVNGSLKNVLSKKDRTIDRRKRLLIAMDAAFGMEYLHSKKIVHFDLKSENLLVNMRDPHRPICKVGDFGLSKVKHQTLVSGGVRGTLPWIAPELLSGKGLVTEKVDVYSFGIVMWELLTGEEPYANMHCGTIIGGIVHNNLRPTTPSWCDPSWKQLMERCWSANPADRPDFTAVASELRAIASSMNVK